MDRRDRIKEKALLFDRFSLILFILSILLIAFSHSDRTFTKEERVIYACARLMETLTFSLPEQETKMLPK
jgi:hypothetical protein